MIMNAQEFLRLRTSEKAEEYLRASTEEARPEVWVEILENYPEMKIWVVRNKTVPLEILRRLAIDPAEDVRFAVAMKNKLPEDLMMLLAGDAEESVRARVAYNKNVPKAVLDRLVDDPSEIVAQAARTRIRTGAFRTL